jgi:hypothetical protein
LGIEDYARDDVREFDVGEEEGVNINLRNDS